MAALPTAPQVNGVVIGFGPCAWKHGCEVFSTLTPSCTREGETPPWPHQAPGFAESPGQGVAAMGSSSFWGWGENQPFLGGEKGRGEIIPAAAAPDTTSFSSARGTQGSARTGALCAPGFVPRTALDTPTRAHRSRQSFSAFLCSLPIARAIV